MKSGGREYAGSDHFAFILYLSRYSLLTVENDTSEIPAVPHTFITRATDSAVAVAVPPDHRPVLRVARRMRPLRMGTRSSGCG